MSGIEAWQICIVVTAAIILIETGVYLLRKKLPELSLPGWWRTALLVMLVLLTVVVFVAALGTSLADQLSSVAAAVAAVFALWLAYRSYSSKGETPNGETPKAEIVKGDTKPADADHPTES
ncbi:hypothetical protein [Paractinoplanes atraurantiacus]|uniref:Uncharacterized protein n=1 Tax=Paractinoplanes atraurantiacus TaxID=1036182 RepID=A0A285HFK0_9ACTN|nr:hypothetical protein [Actinoplanes atraurantiacus]SNY34363.1 hypothetical protein SAMN05421748_104267 [Actinoplanes atraurantiacus]